jgi:hypothetical protein
MAKVGKARSIQDESEVYRQLIMFRPGEMGPVDLAMEEASSAILRIRPQSFLATMDNSHSLLRRTDSCCPMAPYVRSAYLGAPRAVC